ncbi:MAG TPA: hypothetical protein VFT22_07200 [Kofleriaceae bacterium]|nr:hypothetical protein [Kofleriaceae bacterium]
MKCVKCGHDPEAVVTASWTLELDKRVTSANLHVVNAGGSRWRYAKERDAWAWLVRVARLAAAPGLAPADRRRRITVERVYAGRCQEIDVDNLVAGVKPLVDAMVREGMARDDSRAWLELHVMQRRAERNVTLVTVEEIADAS